VQLLSRIPLYTTTLHVPGLRAHPGRRTLQDTLVPSDAEIPARDAWLRIEDRVAPRCAPRVDASGKWSRDPGRGRSCVWSASAGIGTGRLLELRGVVIDAETWQYRSQDRVHAFVQWFSYDGDDLLLQFMSLRVMESWDTEMHLPTQVLALLQRLVVQRPQPEPDAPGHDA
jgi:hypothetical protein